jgi:hypothetical protein
MADNSTNIDAKNTTANIAQYHRQHDEVGLNQNIFICIYTGNVQITHVLKSLNIEWNEIYTDSADILKQLEQLEQKTYLTACKFMLLDETNDNSGYVDESTVDNILLIVLENTKLKTVPRMIRNTTFIKNLQI